MKPVASMLIAIVLALFAAPAAAQCTDPGVIDVPNGYLTGERLLRLSDGELAGYVVGFINGALFSVVTGSEPACIEQLELCIAGRSPAAIAVAVRRYLGPRPDFIAGPAERRRHRGPASDVTDAQPEHEGQEGRGAVEDRHQPGAHLSGRELDDVDTPLNVIVGVLQPGMMSCAHRIERPAGITRSLQCRRRIQDCLILVLVVLSSERLPAPLARHETGVELIAIDLVFDAALLGPVIQIVHS